MLDPLDPGHGFASLSVQDLLEARDLYHNHLLGKPNVVGTAVGLYLIRDADHAAHGHGPASYGAERTLGNAHVQDYSWPCVLAFVREWLSPGQFGGGAGQHRPDNAIPTRLYMPDGRTVPVCIVKVTPSEAPHSAQVLPNWPDALAGGGYPLLVEVQGAQRVASAGCLVSDGHTTYALTNRHVCGAPGEPVFTRLRGKQVRIGQASDKQLTRKPFTEAYPGYPGARSYAALDVGLVELDDVTGWTSQVYGIGAPGELADLNARTFSLRLIGASVSAHGAASGPLDGSIMALFYRYKSVGGFDWVADFLIAPGRQEGGPQTRPGDSGTVWFLPPSAPDGRPRPLAIQWGGQSLLSGQGRATVDVALATSLSTVCNLLDVDVSADHNTGVAQYWGAEGHYTIAALACQETADPALSKLMQANAGRIAFDVAAQSPDAIKGALQQAKDNAFVPLADVPDIVWKQSPHAVPGGRDTQANPATHRSTGPEHPNHYADADLTRPEDGRSLRALCLEDPARMTPAFWQSFYDAAGMTESRSRGLLPFRCWQFFDAMTDAVRAGDAARFVCAAGILSHYVGDACQPLHGSVFSDGYPDGQGSKTVRHRDGTTEQVAVKRGQGVHSAYEDGMVNLHATDLQAGIPAALRASHRLPLVRTGQEAALAVLRLMDRTAQAIPPQALVDAYMRAGGGRSRPTLEALWNAFGAQTANVMADGARVLSSLWDSAWAAGGGIRGTAGPVPEAALQALYEDAGFVPSLDLDHIGPALRDGPAPGAGPEAAAARPSKGRGRRAPASPPTPARPAAPRRKGSA